MSGITILLLVLLCCWAIPADIDDAQRRNREREEQERKNGPQE
jgi:hypothetical protein